MSPSSFSRLLCWPALLVGLAGCGPELQRAESEPELEPSAPGVVRVSQEMQEQLGLACHPAARRDVRDSLSVTGWLEAEPGTEVQVKAPIAGFVTAGSGQHLPRLGQVLERGAGLASLQVFLSPQEIAQLVSSKEDVDIAIEQARVSMSLAQEQFDRLNVARDAVSGARLAELKEIIERAKAAYKESRDKLPYLLQEPYEGQALVKPIMLDAPIAGHVAGVHAARDQFVTPGDPLWTIADWSSLWLRVAVFESDLPRVNRDAEARITLPGSLQTRSAAPVQVLLPTQRGFRTVELVYEVRNPDLALRVGQALTVEVPTGAAVERVIIPRGAVLWDGFGNAWVYVRRGGDTFQRQRIETGGLVAQEIIVTRGLSGAEEVVAVGAETLYGEEFKGLIPAGDED
jgi:Cu(I)/Ag(I) efflux system membrane fusion protein